MSYDRAMRSRTALFFCVGIGSFCVVRAGAGCGSGSTLLSDDAGEGGPGVDASSDSPSAIDGATNDAGGDADATPGDCKLLGGTYDKTCVSPSDCTTVARGCYCGQQPVIGVAKSASVAANACETKAGSECGLGCANFPGQVAEDGKSPDDGGTLSVECTANKCTTVVK